VGNFKHAAIRNNFVATVGVLLNHNLSVPHMLHDTAKDWVKLQAFVNIVINLRIPQKQLIYYRLRKYQLFKV
jgi:hypothetical protein